MSMRRTTRAQSGITLIECIVAVSILIGAISGPLALTSQSLKASRDARNELIATNLAQEAIEILHNIRDNNSADDVTIDRRNWMLGVMNDCGTGEGCIIDPTDHSVGVWGPDALIPCPLGTCSTVNRIYEHSSTHMYRQSLNAPGGDWQPTELRRWMKVEGIDDASNPLRQVRATVTVTYAGYSGTRTVEIKQELYNWFPELF